MKKLLIIENDPDLLDLVSYISEDSNFSVIKSLKKVSIPEVIAIDPHIIIIDYRLDDGFGDDLCREIKADELTRHIPVILYSASRDLKTLAEQCGATAILQKPFDLTDLEHILATFAL